MEKFYQNIQEKRRENQMLLIKTLEEADVTSLEYEDSAENSIQEEENP